LAGLALSALMSTREDDTRSSFAHG
jgi:hypothetical protein